MNADTREGRAAFVESDNAPSAERAAQLALMRDEFDDAFYRAQYPQLAFEDIEPLAHFAEYGWRAGRDPSPRFSVEVYLARHEDVRDSGVNPLLHYVLYGRIEGRAVAPSRVASEPSRAASEATPASAEALARRADLDLMRAEFDEAFYLAQNSDLDFDGADPLSHFADQGWREGRDPTPWFSVDAYLARHDDVRDGEMNPLLHYVLHGRHEGRLISPSRATFAEAGPAPRPATEPALDPQERLDMEAMSREFDEDYYREQNADVSFERIRPLEHFARRGWREGRDPNRWFSLRAYSTIHAANPFLHFLRTRKGDDRAYLDASLISTVEAPSQIGRDDLTMLQAAIDPDYYRAQLPNLDFNGLSPAEHYEIAGWRSGLDPTPDFSTRDYLALNEDVRRANVNPFLHYLRIGRAENRELRVSRPAALAADGASEWADYSYVRQRAEDSLEGCSPDTESVEFVVSLLGADLGEAVARMSFSRPSKADEPPLVSIVIPCLNEELATAECLLAIAQALPEDFGVEVLIADNGSTDRLYRALAVHSQLRVLHFETNIGFGPAVNAAAEQARGEFLFLLNNDTQIAPGCLERLFDAFRDPREGGKIGAVGPKLLFFNGLLQEAGCLLNRDGTGALIGFARDPRAPRFNYRRAVEHVSGAAVLISRRLFAELGGFDPIYAPAYCEDADLSLKIRQRGLRIVYEPSAVVAHHLSRTTHGLADADRETAKRKRIAANRQTLLTRWAGVLGKTDVRTIAFYLPQFHPIKENDLWWGKGFTEWTNVGRAKPNFVGHDQPRVPADLGYYDLRLPDILEAQAALAAKYGVTGFCYYYYNFDGARLLEAPLERMLATGKPDLPFCLCWANENWTRRWDGRDNEILMGQSYSDEAMVSLADDVARYFRAPNYIRVDGKPLLLIYRIKEMPNPRRVTGAWRNRCRAIGLGEICIAMVESFDLSPVPEPPQPYGCDMTVEFPAHGMVNDPQKAVERLNLDWKGAAHDYRELARAFMRRVEPGFPRLRSVLAGWDSTPRHQDRSLVLQHATPGAFQAWLEWTYRRTMEQNLGDSRLVFINAWNEWGEGSYLEPDRRFGHGYLQAVRNALDSVETSGGAFDA